MRGEKGLIRSIDESVSWWFGHIERMGNSKMLKGYRRKCSSTAIKKMGLLSK